MYDAYVYMHIYIYRARHKSAGRMIPFFLFFLPFFPQQSVCNKKNANKKIETKTKQKRRRNKLKREGTAYER